VSLSTKPLLGLLPLALTLVLGVGQAALGQAGGPPETKSSDQQSGQPSSFESQPAKPPEAEEKRPYAEAAVKHYNRGVELHQSGFLNQAITEYRSAIEAEPRMEEAHSNLGLIYAAQRNYTKAIEAFNKALSLKPARPKTLNGLGTVLYARGKVQEAMEKWKQAIAIDPQFASAYYNMGNALESEKDYPGALDAYVKAIRIDPSMADAYYRIGTIFNKEKHAAQASVLLAKAVELSPDAEFARDAKRQLDGLKNQFAREATEEPEVQMNVMPPPAGAPVPTSPAPGPELQPAPPGGSSAVPGGTAPARNVTMFIQPPAGSD
jgi:tetratricopeptide (TPR) repeat protein